MTQETIDRIIDGIIEREGGLAYTNRSSDRGGPTKSGITLRTLSAWRLRHGLDPATAGDVKALLPEEIREIYEALFIRDPRYDLIEDQQLFEHVVDSAVHHGQGWATETLQKILGVKQDGIIGPVTLGKLRLDNADRLNLLLGVERMKLFASILVKDARKRNQFVGQIENAEGWFNRLSGFFMAEAND